MSDSGTGSKRPPRQSLPDEVRAVALLGIVLVNAPFIAVGLDGFTDKSLVGPLDRATAFLITALAEAKFYLLFSFLFGYSANFIVRPGAVDGRRRWSRRLLGLALIGLAHAVFFFVGDILLAYAILGAGLIPLLGRSDRTVLITGAVVAGIGLLWLGLLTLAVLVGDPGITDQDGERQKAEPEQPDSGDDCPSDQHRAVGPPEKRDQARAEDRVGEQDVADEEEDRVGEADQGEAEQPPAPSAPAIDGARPDDEVCAVPKKE